MEKIFNPSLEDFEKIYDLIVKNGLSYYELDRKDFLCYKNKEDIVAFWRIYNIWENNYELSSLLVNEKYRWNKLGIQLIKDLINEKLNYNFNLFLACKREMESYYKEVNFEKVNEDIPEKLLYTLKWAEENNIDAIIMKYKK